ncbi:MAG: site-2 protease family protein [Candidatus Micrarchaeia archaeon]
MDNQEMLNIFVALTVISFAFSVAFAGVPSDASFAVTFAVVLLTVGAGFVLHELAHKYTAQHYGAFAAFRAWPVGLLVAVMTSFMGIVFAAPGAVYIFGPHLNRKQNGVISIAGPLTNLVVALFFAGVLFFVVPLVLASGNKEAAGMVALVGGLGYKANAWLGLFNTIPFFPFDGEKIFKWNAVVWVVLTAVLFLLVFGPAFFAGTPA